jgi:hypothetical protein
MQYTQKEKAYLRQEERMNQGWIYIMFNIIKLKITKMWNLQRVHRFVRDVAQTVLITQVWMTYNYNIKIIIFVILTILCTYDVYFYMYLD